MRKNFMLSIVTALFIIGCQGHNGPDDLVIVPKSNGQTLVVAGHGVGTNEDSNFKVLGKNSEGKMVTTANIFIPSGSQPKDARGDDACVDEPCTFSGEQLCATDTSTCSNAQAEKIASSVPNVGANEVALYAGTLDIITKDNVHLTNCGMEVTVDVPDCVVWEESTRPNQLHGVPACATMRVWVAPLCSSDTSEGRWIDAQVSECKTNGKRTITFALDSVPSHIVMYVIFKLNWLTGGSK